MRQLGRHSRKPLKLRKINCRMVICDGLRQVMQRSRPFPVRSRGLPRAHLNTSNEVNGVRCPAVPPNPTRQAGSLPAQLPPHVVTPPPPRRPPTHAMLGDMPDVRDTPRRDSSRRSPAVGARLARQVAGLPWGRPRRNARPRPSYASPAGEALRVREREWSALGRSSVHPRPIPVLGPLSVHAPCPVRLHNKKQSA